ncbi:MAG: bifunctional hydroxymethylpyrimidine kinase/phosphomethylpyrimidine kinase [Oligoflexia bacterium]|nr:bifunctional hydroxymethylpyrimidine kinase/phosphomethylpyrimidine kinase [Oligoflexia bacterium]
MIPVLSIAGSDPSGGAGVQADLKTFLDHGVYGMAAITAITAQNTLGLARVQSVQPDLLADQIRLVLADIPPAAVKIGMLKDVAIVDLVADLLSDYPGPIVLDPVILSTSGTRLLDAPAQRALVTRLAPLATVITPNLPEATVLLGGQEPAAWASSSGVAVLLTDGHGDEATVRDRLYLPDGSSSTVSHPRLDTPNSHGTGCTLSSALAARLARGEDLTDAAHAAVAYVTALLSASATHKLGAGNGPLLHGRAAREAAAFSPPGTTAR